MHKAEDDQRGLDPKLTNAKIFEFDCPKNLFVILLRSKTREISIEFVASLLGKIITEFL